MLHEREKSPTLENKGEEDDRIVLSIVDTAEKDTKDKSVPISKEDAEYTAVAIDKKAKLELSRHVKMGISVGGIMAFFLLYGILQERIITTPYGTTEKGEPIFFEETTFLVLSNRLFAVLVAVVIQIYNRRSLKNVAPLHKYFGVSVSNFSATWCQYEALKYVNFPTQTLGKCGKMLPVMIVGSAYSGKKYSAKDYGVAIGVTVGCMVFLLTGDISSKATVTNTPFGLMLMGAYMFFDGFTSTAQEKMFKGYTMSTQDQMIYVSGSSAVICLIIMLVKQTLVSSINFTMAYPAFLWDSTMLSFCSTFGQMIIYYTIKEFGALFFSTVMVTRQVFSVILSCIIFLHPLTPPQWVGFAMVFGTLYYKAMEDRKKHSTGSSKH